MKPLKFFAISFFVLNIITGNAQPRGDSIGTVYSINNLPGHDPVLIKENNTYYLFCTGRGIAVFSSKDMRNWKKEPPVFSEAPAGAVAKVPGFRGHIWAPDIQQVGDKYFLYYSVSTFGKNTSTIGVAVNQTLDRNSPAFKWVDNGLVISSLEGRHHFNAIDPNLVLDENKVPWLSFGSFWNGILLTKLDSTLTKPVDTANLYNIASSIAKPAGIENPIEAPFIFRHGSYYYLFVSKDFCCRGEKSTYHLVVGRSKEITGPYMDDKGKKLLEGGGKKILGGDTQRWFAAGHNGIFKDTDNTIYLVAHGYDRNDNGRSKIILQRIMWDNNEWPLLGDNF